MLEIIHHKIVICSDRGRPAQHSNCSGAGKWRGHAMGSSLMLLEYNAAVVRHEAVDTRSLDQSLHLTRPIAKTVAVMHTRSRAAAALSTHRGRRGH